MKISVVMATYNGEKYITEQLDTIRNQTRKIDELVVCDDRSKDNTVSVVKAYIKEHNLEDAWAIHVNERNLGYANNFHRATLMATGDLIFFSDQDDLWREDKIEIMANHWGILKSDLIEENTEDSLKKTTNNRILTDIIGRAQADGDFFALLETVYRYDTDKIKMLSAFLKQF